MVLVLTVFVRSQIHALTTLRALHIAKPLVYSCLLSLEKRIMLVEDEMLLCEAIRSTDLLRSSIELPMAQDISGDSTPEATMKLPEFEHNVVSDENILDVCNRVLPLLLSKAVFIVPTMRAKNLRTVLTVALNQPAHIDMIDAIDSEIRVRLDATDDVVVSDHLTNVTAIIDTLNDMTLGSGENADSSTYYSTLLSSLASLVGFTSSRKLAGSNEMFFTGEERSKQYQTAIASASDEIASALNLTVALNLDHSIRRDKLYKLLDLDMCSRLIDQHRRDAKAHDNVRQGDERPDHKIYQSHRSSSRLFP
jgi:hypothetical protein